MKIILVALLLAGCASARTPPGAPFTDPMSGPRVEKPLTPGHFCDTSAEDPKHPVRCSK